METLSANALTYRHIGKAVTLRSRVAGQQVNGVIEHVFLLPNVVGVQVAYNSGGSDTYLLLPVDDVMVKPSPCLTETEN